MAGRARNKQERRPRGMNFGWAPHPFQIEKKSDPRCKVCGLPRDRNDMHTDKEE